MWSVGGGVVYIPATFNAEEGLRKGMATTDKNKGGIPDWDKQYREQKEAKAEAERLAAAAAAAAEELTGVEAAHVLEARMMADLRKRNSRRDNPEGGHKMLEEEEEEEVERRERKKKKSKSKRKSKKRSHDSSDDSSSSSSSSDSDSDSSDSSDDERKKKRQRKERKKRKEREEKKKKSKKSKKSKKEEKRSKDHMSQPVSLSEFLAAGGSDSDDGGKSSKPRSAISGMKIQMKVKRTTEDKEEEKRRQKYLKKLNAVVGAEFVDDD